MKYLAIILLFLPSSSFSFPDFLLSKFGETHEIRVNRAIEVIKEGGMVILVDDDDRENEGDLIIASEKIDRNKMNFIIQNTSGIVCLVLTSQRAKELKIFPMVKNNTSKYSTPFGISIEAKKGVTTGVSADDRTTTILAAIKNDAKDLSKPGHIFPLIAKDKGVLERKGHTEGSLDLVKLSHLYPSAVLCELMNKDGTMMKGKDLADFAEENNLTILSVQDIIKFRKFNKL